MPVPLMETMNTHDTTAGLMKRLIESTAAQVDWSKAREVLNVNSREDALKLLAAALITARAKLAKEKADLLLLVKAECGDLFITLDMMGLVVGVSQEGGEVLGWPVDELVGKPIDKVLQDRLNAMDQSAEEMRKADLGATVHSVRTHTRADGTTFDAQHVLIAILGRGGHVSGFIRRIEDVSSRKAHETHIEELDATIALLLG